MVICQRLRFSPPGAELCSVGKCKALYDYSSEKKDELNMKEGTFTATRHLLYHSLGEYVQILLKIIFSMGYKEIFSKSFERTTVDGGMDN